MNDVNPLWVERYRPRKIEDCILPEQLKDTLRGITKDGTLPNLLFSGPAGIGKTTVAKALCSELGFDVMVINGSDEGRLIDTLRTKITQFASSVSMDGTRKICILDEADYMGKDIQAALRNFMEAFSRNCGFILTCNYPNQIIEPLRSRCSVVTFEIPKTDKVKLAGAFLKRVEAILKENGIEYDKKAVADFILKYFPDWRRTLNELQRVSKLGKIDSISTTNFGEASLRELVGFLKNKEFKAMRGWVATNPSLDMAGLCRGLYEKADELIEASTIPFLVLIIAKYQYQHAFVADAEINIVAMLTEMMGELKWK